MTIVMVVGLITLAVGAIELARATWQSDVLPGWAGVALAAGLALWLPLLPRTIRIVDGLTIGLGGVWLAWAIWRKAARTSIWVPRENEDPSRVADQDVF